MPAGRVLTWASAGLTALVAAAVILLLNGPLAIPGVGVEPLRHRVDSAGPAGPVLFVALLSACVVFAPVPNTPFYIVSGAVWGSVLGSVYAMAGATLGSAIAFALAREIPHETVLRLGGAELRRIMTDPRLPPAAWVVFWARLLPATNFDWINYLAGMTGVRFVPFVLATALGMAPATIATVVAGSTVEDNPRVAFGIVVAWVVVLGTTWPLAVGRWRRATGHQLG